MDGLPLALLTKGSGLLSFRNGRKVIGKGLSGNGNGLPGARNGQKVLRKGPSGMGNGQKVTRKDLSVNRNGLQEFEIGKRFFAVAFRERVMAEKFFETAKR